MRGIVIKKLRVISKKTFSDLVDEVVGLQEVHDVALQFLKPLVKIPLPTYHGMKLNLRKVTACVYLNQVSFTFSDNLLTRAILVNSPMAD